MGASKFCRCLDATLTVKNLGTALACQGYALFPFANGDPTDQSDRKKRYTILQNKFNSTVDYCFSCQVTNNCKLMTESDG